MKKLLTVLADIVGDFSFLTSTEFGHFTEVLGGEGVFFFGSSSASTDGSPLSVDSSVFVALTLFLRLLATVVFLLAGVAGELTFLDDGLSFFAFDDLFFLSVDFVDDSGTAGNLSGVSFSFFTGEAALLTSGESDWRLFFPFAAAEELKTQSIRHLTKELSIRKLTYFHLFSGILLRHCC